jgi:hypothetical protein
MSAASEETAHRFPDGEPWSPVPAEPLGGDPYSPDPYFPDPYA